jgi:hypothetical protein
VSGRAALAARAIRLRGEGRSNREIAAEIDRSASYVSSLIVDPDGSLMKARKDGYRKPCPSCGALMDGSGGPNRSPDRCVRCANRRGPTWTRELVISSFETFRDLTGRSPTTVDAAGTAPTVRAGKSAARLAEIDAARELIHLPAIHTVERLFGGWTDAVVASGMVPAPGGPAGHR